MMRTDGDGDCCGDGDREVVVSDGYKVKLVVTVMGGMDWCN